MVSTTLGRSLSIVNTSADPGRVDSSDAALADHLKVLAMYLKELAKSFSSHFLMHPILVPANGYRDQRYYLFMHIGSYVKNMIYMMCQQRGTGCESASDATRLSALIRIGCNVTDAVYDRDSVQWQEIGYWWEKRSTGPTIDDERMFLTTLRKQGLVQLPQLGCCTCRTRFDVLHRSIFRLCLKLRLANVDYAFAETVRRQPDPD